MKNNTFDSNNQFVKALTDAKPKNTNSKNTSEQKITRSHSTISSYLKRAQQIINAALRQSGNSESSLTDVISWVIDHSANKSPSTIRLYKASLNYYMELQFNSGVISEKEFESLSFALSLMKSKRKEKTKLTSAKKAKCANHDIIRQLIDELNKHSSEFSKLAALLFMGSLVAGLRPIEWEHATISRDKISDGAILTIRNAKATNGRSFGIIRELYIPEAHVALIEHAINKVSNALKLSSWDKIYGNCRKAIQRTKIKSRNKNISLYTARHQFIANMKNIYSREEVAIMVGHGSIQTAAIHYGRRRNGHPEFKGHVSIIKQNQTPSI